LEFHKRFELFEKEGKVMHEVITHWLKSCELTAEQNVLAVMLTNLAKDYDDKRFTSTMEALRRSYNDLREQLKPADADFDPLRDLMTR
jgi:hypothetical protein